MCPRMFRAPLCVMTPNWKLPKYPSIPEQIHKFWYSHTMEYHRAMSTNNVQAHTKTHVNLTDIMLSERNQTQKNTYTVLHDSFI